MKLTAEREGNEDDGDMREEPYYWTMSLTGFDHIGAGYYADVALLFEDDVLHVKINGREFMDVPYQADKNAYNEEDQVVITDGFYCRGGLIKELRYRSGYNGDGQLYAGMVKEDGSTEEVVFHKDSEECLYLTE